MRQDHCLIARGISASAMRNPHKGLERWLWPRHSTLISPVDPRIFRRDNAMSTERPNNAFLRALNEQDFAAIRPELTAVKMPLAHILYGPEQPIRVAHHPHLRALFPSSST